MIALRRRAGEADRDAGIGMVELIAASFISVLMLALVSSMFVQITKLTGNGQSTNMALGVAWTAMNEVAGATRQATQVATSASSIEGGVIAGSTPTSLVLDSFDRATVTPGQSAVAPTRVTFAVDASGRLIESRVTGVLTGSYYGFSGPATTTFTGGPLVTSATGTDALFVYYTGSGSTLTPVVPAATGLTTAQAVQITTVGVNVVVANTVSSGSDPVKLTNQVTMPNIAILNGGN